MRPDEEKPTMTLEQRIEKVKAARTKIVETLRTTPLKQGFGIGYQVYPFDSQPLYCAAAILHVHAQTHDVNQFSSSKPADMFRADRLMMEAEIYEGKFWSWNDDEKLTLAQIVERIETLPVPNPNWDPYYS